MPDSESSEIKSFLAPADCFLEMFLAAATHPVNREDRSHARKSSG